MNRVNNLPEKYKAMMEEYQKVNYFCYLFLLIYSRISMDSATQAIY